MTTLTMLSGVFVDVRLSFRNTVLAFFVFIPGSVQRGRIHGHQQAAGHRTGKQRTTQKVLMPHTSLLPRRV
jgi:hypothetical protein